jgi:hypothetical protein
LSSLLKRFRLPGEKQEGRRRSDGGFTDEAVGSFSAPFVATSKGLLYIKQSAKITV